MESFLKGMMRRPVRPAGIRISLGRRLSELESFVSRSCVGDQSHKFKRHRIGRVSSPMRPASREKSDPPARLGSKALATTENHLSPPSPRTGDRIYIVVKEAIRGKSCILRAVRQFAAGRRFSTGPGRLPVQPSPAKCGCLTETLPRVSGPNRGLRHKTSGLKSSGT
jgi:hypothetical protein